MTQTARQIGIKTHRENKIVSQFHSHDKTHTCVKTGNQIRDDGTQCKFLSQMLLPSSIGVTELFNIAEMNCNGTNK